MYLFQRTTQAKAGQGVEAGIAAVTIAEKATTITGHDIYLWRAAYGAPIGTMSWSMRVDSQAQLIEIGDKLEADPQFMELQLGLALYFEGDMIDRLVSIISGTPAPAPAHYTHLVEASMAEGKYGDAVAFGTGMQEFIHQELGLATMFGAMVYGGFADVIWVTGCETSGDLDRLNEFQMTNPEYHQRVDSAAGLFVESSGRQGLIERVH